ncbi:MAG: DNA polymerase III subunit delta [Bacilli bacterium]
MIFVFFGPDYGLNLAKANSELKARMKKEGTSELIKYDGYNDLVQDAVTECSSLSLFGEKKNVLFSHCYFLSGAAGNTKSSIKESSQDYEAFISYIKNPDPNCDLYLVSQGNLDAKKSDIVLALKELPAIFANCAEMTKEDYVSLAFQMAKAQNKDIDRKGAELLFQRTSYTEAFKTHGDYLMFVNELNKLLTYNKAVREDDVRLLVHKPLEDNVFDIVSSILDDNVSKAVSTYKDIRKGGYDPMQLIPIFISQLRMMALAKYGIEQRFTDSEIASDLKISSGRLYFIKKESKRVSYHSLLLAIKELGEREMGIKLSNDDGDTSLILYMTLFRKKYFKKRF